MSVPDSNSCRCQFRLVIGPLRFQSEDQMKREARGKQDVDPFWLWGSNDVIGPLVLALGGVIETERRRRGERGLNWSTPPFPSPLSIVQDCTNLTSRLAYYFLARKLVRASCNIFIFILGNQLRTASSLIDLASKEKSMCEMFSLIYLP